MKKFLLLFIPPILIKAKLFFRKKNASYTQQSITWKGNYVSWQAALSDSDGYSHVSILLKVKESILKVKTGEAAYERDSVLFSEIQYSWPVLSALLLIATKQNKKLNIIDFGGSLGTLYFQYRAILENVGISLQWHVVEQDSFVEIGKQEISDEKLFFYSSIEESLESGFVPNLIIISGVLQCIEKPNQLIQEIINFKIENIIIDRTAFINKFPERITKQNVPEWIYKASYPCRFFEESKLKLFFNKEYELITEFDSFVDVPITMSDGAEGYWKGFYYSLKK